jgi:thiol-disulfide isomerase/thioredoxin
MSRAWRAWQAAPPARWLIVAGLIVLAFAVAEVASGGGNSNDGREAPPLPEGSIQHPVDLSELRGKPALVDFFASWCGPCHEEAPTLQELSSSLGAKATVVAVDWNDASGPARAFVHKYGWKFPVLADTDGSVGESYGVDIGLPTSFVLDPQGRIVAKFEGPQSVARLRRALLEAA